METNSNCSVIILAAGLGKRMHSSTPKVLHTLCGKPMIIHLLESIQNGIPGCPVLLVLGYGYEKILKEIKDHPSVSLNLDYVLQKEQLGTGDAAKIAVQSEWGQKQKRNGKSFLILPGDLPLLSHQLIREMAKPLVNHSLRVLTCQLADPHGYGRIVRKEGKIAQIVEERDASDEQKAITEVGVSIYNVNAPHLDKVLALLENRNAQKEYYLTDIIQHTLDQGQTIEATQWKGAQELRGVNTLWELAQAEAQMLRRLIEHWANLGVRFLDPLRVRLDTEVILSPGVVLYPDVILQGHTRIGSGCVIESGAVLKNSVLEEDVVIKTGSVIEQSQIGRKSQIGPYAHLRPESKIGEAVKIGNFVELKKAVIGDETRIAHLSYLGDAEVGRDVNIGCGFITCNFDGRTRDGQRKHRTIIEDHAFLGSDCQVIAPIRIGRGAYVASGSTLTDDVEPDALAIARSRQVVKKDYAKRFKKD